MYAYDPIYEDSCYAPDHSDFGYVHKDDLPDFNDTREFLTGALEALFDDGDVEKLDRCLEQLCAQYDVKFPFEKNIKLQKKA